MVEQTAKDKKDNGCSLILKYYTVSGIEEMRKTDKSSARTTSYLASDNV
jgi:hypothetical protein